MPDLRLTITTDALAQETYYYFYIDGYVYRTVYPDGKEEPDYVSCSIKA
ncbi:hypothetical protein R6242_21830 [Iodobacter sp. CM08]|nr:hypothetical protein [Iodobacter sp. CM08]MDW5419218.1 hypothetical protein [Iodobacter sp. CM08]